jgi:sec-independent protein translocase protein TatA
MFPGGIGTPELIVFGIIALLLFGKRLPEVARSLGKGLTEFKKGMRGVEDDFRGAYRDADKEPSAQRRPEPLSEENRELRAPKFEPPKSEPVATTSDGAE